MSDIYKKAIFFTQNKSYNHKKYDVDLNSKTFLSEKNTLRGEQSHFLTLQTIFPAFDSQILLEALIKCENDLIKSIQYIINIQRQKRQIPSFYPENNFITVSHQLLQNQFPFIFNSIFPTLK